MSKKRPNILNAFASRNYRLFFFGQAISLTGLWISQTASLWVIYQLDASPLNLGLVGFSGQIPVFFMAPFVGVWADRADRQRLLLRAQAASMLVSFGLAALILTSHISSAWLIGLSFLQGILRGIEIPTRQAMIIHLVERREHLANAIALNSSLFNLSRLIGPAIAGFVIAAFGAGVCYLIHGLSFIAIIVSLLAMKLSLPASSEARRHPLAELRAGFAYVFKFHPMRTLILTLAVFSLVGFSYAVLLPLFARELFSGDARALGYLMSAAGLGALAGAIYLGSRSSIQGLDSVIARGGCLMGAGLIAFSMTRAFSLSCLCLMMVGFGGSTLMASINTLVQSMVDEGKRGRVTSIFTMSFTGMMPVGNLLAGAAADKFDPFTVLEAAGALCLIAAFVFYGQIPRLRNFGSGGHVLEKDAQGGK